MMDFETFCSLSKRLINVDLSEDQLRKFYRFADLLAENNKKFNITAITEPHDVISKHFSDCLELAKYINGMSISNICLLDVGAGGGFPSIPLAIYDSSMKITALDSTAKKLSFIDTTASDLNLTSLNTLVARAEEVGKDPQYREKYTIVTARAVSRLNVLLELCAPFACKGGYIIAMKGQQAKDELDEAKNAIDKLKLKFVEMYEYKLPELDDKRFLLVFKKLGVLPDAYPRNYSQISKRPL